MLCKNLKIKIPAYEILILPADLCGSRTWYLMIKDEHKIKGL
jgi:hypothetical protein